MNKGKKSIAIVGGGASGTLLAINLLKLAEAGLEINLIEKCSRIGRGVAYSTQEDVHLLNVPAAKMGAFPDDVEHFFKWLKDEGYNFEPTSFVPRKIFGDYLHSILDNAANNRQPGVEIKIIDEEVVDLRIKSNRADVILDAGKVIISDKVVLAFGNFLPPHPNVENNDFENSRKYFRNPWDPKIYELIEPNDSILILGTGLSMVDSTMQLHRAGHGGKIYAISTRGLLPAVHKLGYHYDSFYDEIKDYTRITDLLKSVRRHIAMASGNSSDWRAVIDSLRPFTTEIWSRLPVAEKRYFKQHLSRYWNVARHRMPAEAADILDKMQTEGNLKILKGRLRKITSNGNKEFEVRYSADGSTNILNADVIINCIGSESNFEKIESTLVQNLISAGYIKNDEISMGLDVTPDGSLIGKSGEISDVLFTLGTALKGVLWESTAVPEIRSQARILAQRLLAE